MTDKGHFAALQEIRSWNTNDVICALKNNGLCDCIEAVKKREITGDKLLELSEMTLGLWKRDLALQNIRKLASFVQDISKSPAKFVCSATSYSDDAWDTDFDDDSEEENHHKPGNGVTSKGSADRNGQRNTNSGVFSKEKMISEVKTSLVTNTPVSTVQPLKVNKSNSYYSRRKINIPSIFASEKTSNHKVHELSASTTKLSSLKAEFDQNKKGENLKPSIPSRPTSLYLKPSVQETRSLTLPKPPEFNQEGSILREICEKFKSETDMNNEDYESIQNEFPLTRTTSNNKINSNGFGLSQFSARQNSESPSRSNSDTKLLTPHTPDSDPENVKSIASCALENKNTLHNILSSAQSTRRLSRQEEESKSFHAVNQDFTVDASRKSPVPLPPRNEITRESSPVSRIRNNSPKSVQRENGEIPCTDQLRVQEYINGANNVENLNIHTDEVYEIIPEDVRSCSSRSDDSEGPQQMKRVSPSLSVPSLPPKPKNALGDMKPSAKNSKSETSATSSSFWSFGSQKEKVQPKEKATQKNNTLPRPPNSYVNDVQRASATRPLPPPPFEGSIQRPVKIPLVQMPWYFNIDRKKAEEILRNCEDGMFVIRPSTQTQNPWTLTLKYGTRSFNICVRHRPDGRYALGTAKPTEQTFSSVEELVKHYTCNELLLYSNGSQAGTVRLTCPPRKDQLNMSLTHSS